jgi:hypothetical protein
VKRRGTERDGRRGRHSEIENGAMSTDSRQDDARRTGDALDRVIDDALEAALRVGPVDLRASVLERLESPARDERRSGWALVFRPALVPVAGAILLVIGVAVTWQHADEQLVRTVTPSAGTADRQTSVPAGRLSPVATGPSAPVRAVERPRDAAPRRTFAAVAPLRREQNGSSTDDRVFASSWLAMDALGNSKTGAGADLVITGDDDSEPSFPGAPAGDLGDPIRPMPPLSLIVIPPIVAAPIVDAPPVSTLATPVSTLSTADISRGRPDPGKPGGVRP